jgi:hypothetical protein
MTPFLWGAISWKLHGETIRTRNLLVTANTAAMLRPNPTLLKPNRSFGTTHPAHSKDIHRLHNLTLIGSRRTVAAGNRPSRLAEQRVGEQAAAHADWALAAGASMVRGHVFAYGRGDLCRTVESSTEAGADNLEIG